MVSFTGSTRAGTEVARIAAATVKRVHQELGGKSPNILLDDADFEKAREGRRAARIRELRPVLQRADAPAGTRGADGGGGGARPQDGGIGGRRRPGFGETAVGPVVSKIQFDRIQGHISQGIKEGAKLVAGGEGRPAGLEKGYYVRPTIFSNVRNDMTIAREEIFGPVLAILPYRDEEEAVRIANDTPYGLQAYIWSKDLARANRIGRRIRAGRVTINGSPGDMSIPFGGFKRSGNGREWGEYGLRDFLEVKAVLGAEAVV